MALNSQDMVNRLQSHAKATRLFDKVLAHEPKTQPGRGLTYSNWVDRIEPARGRSGLSVTSTRVVLKGRIYTPMLQQPQDAIDPNIMNAADKMFEAYSGDFQLGADGRWIDLLGATQGHPLFAESGYINIDNYVYRVVTITIPVIVENAWTQSP